jgi:putative acetyltransferase
VGDPSQHRSARRTLPWTLALAVGASLVHFAHNAQYLTDYPNLPAAWSPAEVYGAWCALTALGLVGWGVYRHGRERAGLTALAVYAVCGFGGLLHYTRAGLTQHSLTMNLTIWGEAAAGLLLLVNVMALWRLSAAASPAGLAIVDIDPQGERALALLAQAAREVRPLYPGATDAAAPLNTPLGAREVYVAAVCGNAAIACGSLRTLDATTAELCRLYVRADLRRQGIARALVGHLLARAARLGYQRVRLETGERQAAALALYEGLGFRPIAPFGAHRADPTSVCYELEVTPAPGAAGGC